MKKPPKNFLAADEWESFRKQYESSDDRTCGILCASYIDDCLSVLLESALLGNKKSRDGLLTEMMPLSSFSARIKMAHCLNIIHDCTYADLERIRSIRNAFAHRIQDLSFSKDPIRSICLGLEFPKEFLGGDLNQLHGNPRQHFMLTCAMFSSFFERPSGIYYVRAQKCQQALVKVVAHDGTSAT